MLYIIVFPARSELVSISCCGGSTWALGDMQFSKRLFIPAWCFQLFLIMKLGWCPYATGHMSLRNSPVQVLRSREPMHLFSLFRPLPSSILRFSFNPIDIVACGRIPSRSHIAIQCPDMSFVSVWDSGGARIVRPRSYFRTVFEAFRKIQQVRSNKLFRNPINDHFRAAKEEKISVNGILQFQDSWNRFWGSNARGWRYSMQQLKASNFLFNSSY